EGEPAARSASGMPENGMRAPSAPPRGIAPRAAPPAADRVGMPRPPSDDPPPPPREEKAGSPPPAPPRASDGVMAREPEPSPEPDTPDRPREAYWLAIPVVGRAAMAAWLIAIWLGAMAWVANCCPCCAAMGSCPLAASMARWPWSARLRMTSALGVWIGGVGGLGVVANCGGGE